jgi:CheY-like chemotaxis protein
VKTVATALGVAAPTVERVARNGFEGAPLSLRVLVAEDNIVNQKVVSRLLERWGVQVVVVGDGMSAVDATDRSGFDVILMDVRMPRLDGLQASEEIRSREVVGKRVRTPIVAMTANSDSSDRERCREAGMDGFLAKPIQPAELYAELVRSAGQQGMARAA